MQRFARVENKLVVEIIEIPNGIVPGEDVFTPEFAATLARCSNGNVSQGWTFDGTKFAETTAPTRDLGEIKAELKSSVDLSAETERLKYITPGTGQAMTYQQKVAEAQGYKAATNPKPADYPILGSEVGITAPTLSEVADTVLTAYRQWQQIGAMIEAIRLGAKRDIEASTTEAAARAVVDSVNWPQPAV